MIRHLISGVALAMALALQASHAADGVRNVVLVHGAWADGSSWARVIDKPSWYVVAADDRMIAPDLERRFAATIKATTITLPSSHVAMLSHPAEVAKLIIDAARAAPANR